MKEDHIHVAKEALVISIAKIGTKDLVSKPVLVLPICTHDIQDTIKDTLRIVIKEFKSFQDAKIVNIATDSDSNRRRLFAELKSEISGLSDLRCLELFEQRALLGRFGVNYDPKHIAKRIRGILISSQREIKLISTTVSKSHIEVILKNESNVSSLLNPKDYQNVPLASQLLKLVVEKSKFVDLNTLNMSIQSSNDREILFVRRNY